MTMNPNELDFEQLCKDYIKDYNIKIPFSKSTFVHGAYCNTNIQFDNEKPESELVLTMELVQSPQDQKRNQLVDLKKTPREMNSGEDVGNNAAVAIKEQRNDGESEDSQDQKIQDNESKSEGAEGSNADDDEESDETYESSSQGDSDVEREYTGDMYKGRVPQKFSSQPVDPIGVLNSELNVYEYTCFSIFRTRMEKQRYCRLKSVIIPIPPVSTCQKFKASHSGKAVYYLGEEAQKDGSKRTVIVVISLQDLTHKIYDLSMIGHQLTTIENSCLIMNDQTLSFQHYKTIEIPEQNKIKDISCYSVFDLKNKELSWEIDDVESLMFKPPEFYMNDQQKERNWLVFGDAELNEENERAEILTYEKPEKIFAVRKKTEIVSLNDNRQTAPLQNNLAPRKEEKETRKYFRTYQIHFGQDIDEDDDDSLIFEGYVVAENKVQKKLSKPKPQNQDDQKSEKSIKAPKKKQEKQKRRVLYGTDAQLSTLTIIYHGKKGEQHQIIQFLTDHCEKTQTKGPNLVQQRLPSTTLEFSQDDHLRESCWTFIIQTDQLGTCTARAITDSENATEGKNLMELKNAELGLFKDAWMAFKRYRKPRYKGDQEWQMTTHTICMASKDDSLHYSVKECDEVHQEFGKIKSQQYTIDFPCFAYSLGLDKIKIHSTIDPNYCSTLNLDGREFLSFVNFQNFSDIGLLDKRKKEEKNAIPFRQIGTRIAFMTRNKHGRDGAIYLNVLLIDPFSHRVELLESGYEANMNGGIIDDYIYSAHIAQVSSYRGLDIAYVIQYNDAIVFDCITAFNQKPLRFPMPIANRPSNKFFKDECWSRDQECDIEWAPFELAKGAKPVQLFMQYDSQGAMHFLVQYKGGLIKVLRVDPKSEMGDINFIKPVFSMRCQNVIGFTWDNGAFYLMDEKKQLKRLVQDEVTYELMLEQTLEILPEDKLLIQYKTFDQFIISEQLMHYSDKVIYFSEKIKSDHYTWGATTIMSTDHIHVQGPSKAKGTGMAWYIRKFDTILEEESKDMNEGKVAKKVADNLIQTAEKAKIYKGYSAILKPLADLSYIDILPECDGNQSNFSSFIDSEHILVKYSGRFFVFHNNGQYLGQVKFSDMLPNFKEEQLKMVCMSDNMKYFVFEGPNFDSTATTDKRLSPNNVKSKAKVQKKQKAQKVLYAFELQRSLSGIFIKKSSWKFVELEIGLDYIANSATRMRTRQSIDHNGIFSQAQADYRPLFNNKTQKEDAELVASIKWCQCKPIARNEMPKDKEAQKKQSQEALQKSIFQMVSNKMAHAKTLQDGEDYDARKVEGTFTHETFNIRFDGELRRAKVATLNDKINVIQRRKMLGNERKNDPWKLNQLLDRRAYVDSVWLFTNYIIFKSGTRIRYLRRDIEQKSKIVLFNLTLGNEVWIQDIYATGIDDLVQLFLINDVTKHVFVITWNLIYNREHSNYQTSFDDTTNPEYLLLRSYGKRFGDNFNLIQDTGGLVNLQNNLPVQFFDIETEQDWCPKGQLHNYVQGQKKVQEDHSKIIELTQSGRIQHFISYSDLRYWARFQYKTELHEISKGRITKMSPLARFPTGISAFHMYATNLNVLRSVENFLHQKQQSGFKKDARVTMLALMFLHSDPKRNEKGCKTTPLHVALDQNSQLAFDIMFGLLCEQTKVCITPHLLDRISDIMNKNSDVVLDFFDKSFFITDQYSDDQVLEWVDKDEEKYVAVPTSYLTKEYLQSLLKKPGEKLKDEEPEDKNADKFLKLFGSNIEQQPEGIIPYTNKVEDFSAQDNDPSNLKQVEAKLLEFNWIFNSDLSNKFIISLSKCENDEIFVTSQIKVLIEFFWQEYFYAIRDTLFLPYALYTALFSFYLTYLQTNSTNEFDLQFCFEVICLVGIGKLYMRFLLLEAIQLAMQKWDYFTSFWNYMDLCSLLLNGSYVYLRLSHKLTYDNLGVLGSGILAILWVKMFYWMRIYKVFASFIRVVEAIMQEISVFSAMLFMVLFAFMNIIMVLNQNRTEDQEPIFPPLTQLEPFDAIIHAYLTGLGDFEKDGYSEQNGFVVWMFFLTATFIVQLVFMNLLIALMGDAYGNIMGIKEQSTMKEICCMMSDHIWMLDIRETYKSYRYILSLTPDNDVTSGSAIERQVSQLQEDFVERVDQSDNMILREMQQLREDIDGNNQVLRELLILKEDLTATKEDIRDILGQGVDDEYGMEDEEEDKEEGKSKGLGNGSVELTA